MSGAVTLQKHPLRPERVLHVWPDLAMAPPKNARPATEWHISPLGRTIGRHFDRVVIHEYTYLVQRLLSGVAGGDALMRFRRWYLEVLPTRALDPKNLPIEVRPWD